MNWCRLWHDMPNDPKWRTVAKISKQPITSVICVYLHLMVSASSNAAERGRTQTNAEDLASALDLETDQVESILEAMQGRVLIDSLLSGWGKRQPKREDDSAERAKEWREEQKRKDLQNQERNRTQPNATERDATQRNAPDKRRSDQIRSDTTTTEHIGSIEALSGTEYVDSQHQSIELAFREVVGRSMRKIDVECLARIQKQYSPTQIEAGIYVAGIRCVGLGKKPGSLAYFENEIAKTEASPIQDLGSYITYLRKKLADAKNGNGVHA